MQQCATGSYATLCGKLKGATGPKGCDHGGTKLRCITYDPGTTTVEAFKKGLSGQPKCTTGRRSLSNTRLTVTVKTWKADKANEGDAALKKAVEDKAFAGKLSAAIPGSSGTLTEVALDSHGTGLVNAAVEEKAAGGNGKKGKDKDDNTGLIVGMVILVLCLCLCAAGAAYYFLVVKKKPLSNQDEKKDEKEGEKPDHVELQEVEEGSATTKEGDDATKKYPDTSA